MVVSRSSGPSRMAALVAAVAMAGLLAGCAPEAEPEPQQLFATEDEAFAAAEEVYRAYIADSNLRRAGDEAAQPDRWLVGLALQDELDAIEVAESSTTSTRGDVTVAEFVRVNASVSAEGVDIGVVVCLDMTDVRVYDAAMVDVTPDERPDVAPLEVRFSQVGDGLRISDSLVAGDDPC